MKAVNLEAALQARPFRPFELRVDGDVIVVRHSEQVFFAENKTTVVVDVGDGVRTYEIAATRNGRPSSRSDFLTRRLDPALRGRPGRQVQSLRG